MIFCDRVNQHFECHAKDRLWFSLCYLWEFHSHTELCFLWYLQARVSYMILMFLGMNKKQQKVSAKDEPASGSKGSNTSQVWYINHLWKTCGIYYWELSSWKRGNISFVQLTSVIALNEISNFRDCKYQIQFNCSSKNLQSILQPCAVLFQAEEFRKRMKMKYRLHYGP